MSNETSEYRPSSFKLWIREYGIMELSKRMGLNSQVIGKWMRGKRPTKGQVLALILLSRKKLTEAEIYESCDYEKFMLKKKGSLFYRRRPRLLSEDN